MTLAELGALLREERVGQGLMVEDVAARLKIPARILRAIEEGEAGELPHTVYTFGFIKGYGLILGYSNERIAELLDGLEDFDDGFSPHKIQQMRPVVETETSGGRRVLGLAFKLLIVCLLAGGGYAYYSYTFRADNEAGIRAPESAALETAAQSARSKASSPPSSASSAAPAVSSSSASGPEPSAGSSPDMPAVPEPAAMASADPAVPFAPAVPSSAGAEAEPGVTRAAASGSDAGRAAGEDDAAPEARSTSEAAPVSTQGFALDTPEPSAEGGVTDGATGRSVASEAVLPPGMHQIVLTAEASCWVHANADKTDTREFTLQEGETFAMPFRESLTLRLGNAGGVKIKYDGRDMPSPGKSGQVKTISFPPREQASGQAAQ
ncbi:MAG: DUF4115 domain-containing protein [Desulfovibrionaceae bacterium]|nr:DUF4115 domain-containing protein [Desulfovibrionaceae bacterium]